MPEGGLGALPPAAWLLVAGAVLFLAYRGAAFAARFAIWVEERLRGPQELYGEGRGAWGVGGFGTARTDLAPRGKVFVRGELWDAVAEGPVPAGERVEVVDSEGLVLRVRALDRNGSSSTTRGD